MMPIRDAEEPDAAAISVFAETSADAVREMIRRRTVRVSETADGIQAMVSFDATPNHVQIASLAGNTADFERLLQEPIRFGEQVELPVQMVIPVTEKASVQALESAGFDHIGEGPMFEGTPTLVYRRQ